MPLTEAKIKAASPREKAYRLADGHGLFLTVHPNGTKVFTKAYRFRGQQRTATLGKSPGMKLAEARLAAAEIVKKARAGEDPRGAPKPSSAAGVPGAQANDTPAERRFETLADRFIRKRAAEGVAEATLNKLNWNLGVAKQRFRGRDIASIKPPEILKLVEEIQATGRLEKAKDIHRKMGQVFDYAVALGFVEWNPAHMVKRAIVRTPPGRHPGLTRPEDVGGLMRAIRGYRGGVETRAALMLSAYCFPRSGELRPARWREIDFDGAVWTIPGERMKGRYGDHLIPLSRQAMKILEGLREWTGGGDDPDALLFPSPSNPDRYMSDATLNAALRRMGYDTRKDHCQHGFRTTFSTNMNEQGWNRDWIERQLCHVDRDEVRSAYNKALYLDGRREMMQAYADWLDMVERG